MDTQLDTNLDKVMLGWRWLQGAWGKFGPYLILELVMPGGTLLALLLFLHRRGYADWGSLARRSRSAAGRVVQICLEPVRRSGLNTTGVCP